MVLLIFLLVLLAIAGLLGTFLKAVAFLVLAGMLGVAALAFGGYLAFRHTVRNAQRELDRASTDVKVGRIYRTGSSDPGTLPSGRDDRY
jgi:threonine/homoserine/homoserine lactone efflux protein